MDKSLNNKIFIRTILKNKLFFGINLLGLVIGITVSLFLFLYVKYELGYDSFLSGSKNIYRVGLERSQEGQVVDKDAMTYPALGPAMKNTLSDVKNYVRLKGENGMISRKENNLQFREFKIFYSDNSFFKVFSFPLLKGDPSLALQEPNSVVITRNAEKKYFGNDDAMGKTLVLDGKDVFKVTGVMENIPDNSHLRLDFLFSANSLYKTYGKDSVENSWVWNEFYNYVQLDPGANVHSFEQKLNNLAYGNKKEILQASGTKESLFLQPVRDIHVRSDLVHEVKPAADAKIIYFLLVAGIVILVVGWINYINLTTIKAFERAKEVSMQKVLGADRFYLIKQFLKENTVVNFIAVLIAIGLIWLLPSVIFNYLDTQLFLSNPLQQPFLWVLLGGIFLAGITITGVYPAILLSSFRPVQVLKGKFKKTTKDIVLREALVTFQFFITMVLIGSTIVIYRQVSFMLNADKGITTDKVLAIAAPRVFENDQNVNFKSQFESFKTTLLQNPGVKDVSYSTLVPSKENYWIETVQLAGQDNFKRKDIEVAAVDYDFTKTFEVKMKSGRFFSREFPGDEIAVIINEAAMKYLDIKNSEEALEKKLVVLDAPRSIIGVISNYRNLTLKNNYSPTIYVLRYVPRSYISVKVNSEQQFAQIINYCGAKWTSYFPGNPFEYFFVDDSYYQQYSQEDRFRKIFTMSTLLAIIIACLGLFGLTLYESVLRKKEIGIRKTLGASTFDIMKLLSLKAIKILVIVFALAIPVIHFLMNKWLSNYVEHVGLTIWIYILAAFIVSFITLFTTGWQSVRAAHNNPVSSLRDS